MNTIGAPPDAAFSSPHTTTKRRELIGWIGAMTCMFLMMWGHQLFIVGSSLFINGSWIDSAAMLAFAVFIAVFSFLFGRNPNGLAKIAGYTTPAAIVITAILGLLPSPLASVAYILACILMCPAIARSAYGVARTAKQGTQITRYVIGWTVAMTVFALWVIAALPREITFLIPALFAVLMWIVTPRKISIPDKPPAANIIKFSKSSILLFVLLILVMMWFNLIADMLLNNLFAGGDVTSDTVSVISTLMTWIPLGIGITVFAFISDKGHERKGFIIGMGLFLVSVMCLVLLNDTQNSFYIPLAIGNIVGGMYVVFFASTFPLYFLLSGAKRPIFITSVGVIFFNAFEAVCWKKDLYMPRSLRELGIPLYISAAISAVVFIVLVYLLFERYREKTLGAALYDLLHGKAAAPQLTDGGTNDTDEAHMPEAESSEAMNILLTPEEKKIALLLIDGFTKNGAARKLHLSASIANQYVNTIREKVIKASDTEPDIALAIEKYKLTRREADILRCIRRGMTNPAIAEELSITEGTVKIHVHNLIKKLPAINREDIPGWVETLNGPGRANADEQ